MDKNKFKETHQGFHERFCAIIATQDPSFWAKALEAPYSLVWGWKKGNFPSIEYVIRVCEISGVSPTWLFTGKGVKFIDTTNNVHKNDLSDKERNELQAFILNLEKKLKKEKIRSEELLSQIETDQNNFKIIKWVHDIFGPGIKHVENININDLIETTLIPALNFIKNNCDDIISYLIYYSKSKKAQNLFKEFTKWVKKNKE
ncbi:MAG: helix-turn-helix domain containing protein [Proteobacteria bacterium]|nr:helix-turn-helix domain containing protein [Pseudomonadota bacterium]